MKKIVVILLSFILFFTCVFLFGEKCTGIIVVNCVENLCAEGPKIEKGDFVYCYVNSASSRRRSFKKESEYVAIIGLTEGGKKKETLIIPEKIEELPVVLIGQQAFMSSPEGLDGGIYNKLYLPTTIQQIIDKDDLNGKNFLINLPNEEFFKNILSVFYVPETKYESFITCAQSLNKNYIEYEKKFKVANLTYIVDGNVYWIDDYEEGEKVTFPATPQKEGFAFTGWFKDSECINEWNVEKDVYTKEENINTLNLYAKFEKIEY